MINVVITVFSIVKNNELLFLFSLRAFNQPSNHVFQRALKAGLFLEDDELLFFKC